MDISDFLTIAGIWLVIVALVILFMGLATKEEKNEWP
jgi:hypothetical protein